jgi:hypothetical protein
VPDSNIVVKGGSRMFKKIAPVLGILFIGVVVVAKYDLDDKVMEQVEPLLAKYSKIKEIFQAVS